MYHEQQWFRIIVVSGKLHVPRTRFVPFRFIISICVSTAVVGAGNVFFSWRPRDLWLFVFFLIFCFWGAAVVASYLVWECNRFWVGLWKSFFSLGRVSFCHSRWFRWWNRLNTIVDRPRSRCFVKIQGGYWFGVSTVWRFRGVSGDRHFVLGYFACFVVQAGVLVNAVLTPEVASLLLPLPVGNTNAMTWNQFAWARTWTLLTEYTHDCTDTSL